MKESVHNPLFIIFKFVVFCRSEIPIPRGKLNCEGHESAPPRINMVVYN